MTKTNVNGPFSCNNTTNLACGHKYICNPLPPDPCLQTIPLQVGCVCGKNTFKQIVKCADKH
jgi:hypothetical protein